MISAGGLYVYSHFIAPPKNKAQGDPITKEFIAPDTSLEETPPKESHASQTRTYAGASKHTSFAENVLASQQTSANLQAAI